MVRVWRGLSAGCALALGLLSALAARLFVICLGALAREAVKRIGGWQPIDRADWIGDLLYLPEALYCIGLIVVMLAGPDSSTLDGAIAMFFAA